MTTEMIRGVLNETRDMLVRANEKLKWFESHLGGCCGFASTRIFDRLKGIGLHPIIVTSPNHIFVVCGGMLLDVTATQFGDEPIVMRDYDSVQRGIREGHLRAPWWHETRRYETPDHAGLKACRIDIMEMEDAAR